MRQKYGGRDLKNVKAVILDRDGTIIVDKIYLNDHKQIEYFPRVFEALQLLKQHGYEFAIATNQSGIPKGLVTLENLNLIHKTIAEDFKKYDIQFKGFYYAPFDTNSNSQMRKPNAGMLLEAAKDHNFDLSKSWMVGDRMTDVEAGHRAGCQSILLEGVETPDGSAFRKPEAFVKDLWSAAQFIIETDIRSK